MSKVKWNFSSLRQQISKNNGTILANLMREDLLIDGVMETFDEMTSEMITKIGTDEIKDYIVVLKNLIGIFIETIRGKVSKNTELTKQGLYDTLSIVESLELSSIDTDTLEKLTNVLMNIILSREDVVNWENRAERIIFDLCNIYSFSVFFNVFESNKKDLDAHIYYLSLLDEKIKENVVSKIKKEILRHFQVDDILDNFPIKVMEIDLSKGKTLKRQKNVLIKTNDYLSETPGMGGVLGVIVLSEGEIGHKENEILDSILSIMTLVIGSSKALSKAIKELEFYAGHDPLTGLYNRRMFEHFLQYEIGRVKRKKYRFSLFMQDLDDFKYVNDNYGHPFGDLYLKEVADTLCRTLREGDVIARLGGDEFAVILSETGIDEGKIMAERIKKAFSHKKITTPDGKIIPIKASIGLVEYPTHGQNIEELMIMVDAALYKAKELGKNNVFVPTSMEIKDSLKAQTEKFNIVQDGIDDDRFIPYFQPIYDVSTGEVEAYEVLARLKNEQGEIIPAGMFIGMAERLGKIFDIDRQVIKKAFKKKVDEKNDKPLFINLSGKELKDMGFINEIVEMSKDIGVSASEVVFEITEREAVGDISNIQEFTNFLGFKGFKLAIDDFGSGYSSFFYVKYIPVDYVKIDGEFIKELDKGDVRDLAFVESIQTLCSKLGIKTIAEYMENENIVHVVKDLGISYGQGFHLGMPLDGFTVKNKLLTA